METRKVIVGPRGNTKHSGGEDEFMDVVANPKIRKNSMIVSSDESLMTGSRGVSPAVSRGVSPGAGVTPTTRHHRWMHDSSNFHRTTLLNPGHASLNARFDATALGKYYWYLQCCEVHGTESTRTYFDVYDNHVELNRVSSCPCGCCCYTDHPRYATIDRAKWFSNRAYKAKCCEPMCPFPCIHCFDICGEVMVFDGGCCRRSDTDIAPGFYHWTNCLCSVAAVYGLAPGAAHETCDAVNRSVENLAKGKSERMVGMA